MASLKKITGCYLFPTFITILQPLKPEKRTSWIITFRKKTFKKTKAVTEDQKVEQKITDTNMQQQLMHQIQHRPSGVFNTTNITTDHIQQYLDENKALILNILENQNTGKFSECAENQTRLQHNLMYLAAIADCQPKSSSIHLQQQQQLQLQQMVPNSHMVTQSHTAFPQQPPFTMMQQQHVLQSQVGSGIIQTPRSGVRMEGEVSGVFPDFRFGEVGLHGVISRPTSSLTGKSTSSTEGVHDFPQKKGKLATTAI